MVVPDKDCCGFFKYAYERTLNTISQLKSESISKFVEAAQSIDFILSKGPLPKTFPEIPAPSSLSHRRTEENQHNAFFHVGLRCPCRLNCGGMSVVRWNLCPMASRGQGCGSRQECKRSKSPCQAISSSPIVVVHLRPLTHSNSTVFCAFPE